MRRDAHYKRKNPLHTQCSITHAIHIYITLVRRLCRTELLALVTHKTEIKKKKIRNKSINKRNASEK